MSTYEEAKKLRKAMEMLMVPIFHAEKRWIPLLGTAVIIHCGKYSIFWFPAWLRTALAAICCCFSWASNQQQQQAAPGRPLPPRPPPFRFCMVPRSTCWKTIALISGSYIFLELFAHYFAGRAATGTRLFFDALLAFACIGSCLATAMTDPGILPPRTVDVEFEEAPDTAATTTTTRDATSISTTTVVVMREKGRRPSPLHRHGFASIEEKESLEASRRNTRGHDGDSSNAAVDFNDYLCDIDEKYAASDSHELTVCRWCQHYRPGGCSHSAKTGTCQRDFDHYCGFVESDVSARNLRFFCIFIVLCLCCVLHGTVAVNRPLFNIIVFRDEKLLEEARVRSVVALGVAGAALIVWSVMMAFMVFNYLLMLFVPGAPSTREVWKKICGGSRSVSSSSAASACSMTSIPSNLSTKEDEERSRVRFCNIFFNVPRSCLGAWCRDVMALEFGHVVDDDRVPVAQRATADTAPLVAGAAAAVGAARGAHEDAEELQLDE